MCIICILVPEAKMRRMSTKSNTDAFKCEMEISESKQADPCTSVERKMAFMRFFHE